MNQAKSIFMEYLSAMPDVAKAARNVWATTITSRDGLAANVRERTEGARYRRRGIAEVASKPN
jgi:hypothetical protein